jgi:glyoxylase-like metal-dependent hydrolase (beta-lactamase superfamily II)
MNIKKTVLSALILLTTLSTANAGPFEFEFTELSPGVWAGVRPDAPRFPVMGSTTFIVSKEGVVVFDGGGMPVMSEQVIAKIRSITDAPVTHVIISHWHGDHNFGVYRFAEEYPDVQFVAQSFTAAAMNSAKIQYIERYPDFIENRLPGFRKIIATGKEEDGTVLTESDLIEYRRIIEDADEIGAEFKRAQITEPNVVFDENFTIESGGRTIELKNLGHGNTEGDIVLWLPKEKIVATGDIVVLPSPYAFNVPPRAWAKTLQNINDLDYAVLVPGHGKIQRDTAYVDLLIESAISIADQRDGMLAKGMSNEDVEEQLDFSAFEERFTGGDEYIKGYYTAYFEKPFRQAAMKALTGEPMVLLEPKTN